MPSKLFGFDFLGLFFIRALSGNRFVYIQELVGKQSLFVILFINPILIIWYFRHPN